MKQQTSQPEGYPARFRFPPSKAAWETELPGYAPETYTAPIVLAQDRTRTPGGWADPPTPPDPMPLNPLGRTGLAGRGLLGKWGANHAADPLITRTNPEIGDPELLVIQRRDTREWALPGGMVDEGESATAALAREFHEEAGVELDMSDARDIYSGHVDDPRNTDNAWIVTIVKHKHLSGLVAKTEFKAGDDAMIVKWLPVTPESLENLYASHADFVRKALGL